MTDSVSDISAAQVSFWEIARRLVHHAWPVLVAQVLSVGMMVADTLIAGRYSTLDLAAIAVGSGIYISIVMLLVGILQAVAPTVAHHYGARHFSALGPALRQGFWLALILTVPGVLLLMYPESMLRVADVPPDVSAVAVAYLNATAFGLPAVLFYRTFYAFNNAVGRPHALMVISLIATSVHVPLAWALTHGHFGLPAMGGRGCGVSTAIVCWLGLICGLIYLMRNPDYRQYRIFSEWEPPRLKPLLGLLRLGIPMGFSTFIEVTSFTLVALLVARLGADAVAGHRLVANLSALVYMVPLAMSIATLVLVGQAAGAHDWRRARTTVKVAMIVTSVLALVIGLILWVIREPVIGFATADPMVKVIGLGLIFYVCAYQFFDALQTVAAHALRGYKVTFAPMIFHTLCFWGVGLGGGYWLSFEAPWRVSEPSVAGFWEASVLATLLASVLFGVLLRQVIRRQESV